MGHFGADLHSHSLDRCNNPVFPINCYLLPWYSKSNLTATKLPHKNINIVSVDPKFQVEGSLPINLFSQKTRLNVPSYGIKICTDFSSILSQFTRLTDRQTDGQTDRILIAKPRLHSMQRGNKTRTWFRVLYAISSRNG